MDPNSYVIGLIAPALAYALLKVIQQDKKIAIMAKGHEVMMGQITDIHEDMAGIKTTIKGLDDKLNMFLKKEIDSFTEIVRENTAAMKAIVNKP